MQLAEAKTKWLADFPMLEQYGIHLPEVKSYMPTGFRQDHRFAMDAQPQLVTTSSAGIPAYLTTLIDPDVVRILFSPNQAAKILGERKKGTWTDDTAMFPVVENTGEVSSYGDFNNNGVTGVNANWEQRQAYLYQTIVHYGERELARAGLAQINLAAESMNSAVNVLGRFQNDTYFFGVLGLANYGLLTDPNLPAPITPAPKAWGGASWFNSAGALVATPLEIYNDVVALFAQLVAQSGGLIDAESDIVLAMSPSSAVALTATNNFGVNVKALLAENYPKIRIITAVQYGIRSSQNPRGPVGGNMMQMFATSVEGQDTGYCAYNEKLRTHPIIREMSAFLQKLTQGTWGAVIRMPMAVASMLGI